VSGRDLWDQGAPDIQVIWDKTPRARRAHLCDSCGEEIAVGEVYESRGLYMDGEFQTEKLHRYAYRYPRGCPRFRAQDIAALTPNQGDAK
jgi:hypothetical protein